MITVKCPVCSKSMFQTNTNKLLMCPRKRTRVPELKSVIDMSHAMVLVDDSGNIIMKTLDILPYSFEIHDGPNLKQTRICKMKNDFTYEDNVTSMNIGDKYFEREEVIVVPKALDLEWGNKKKVLERIKMYMLFS
jgi:hypothetical protein